MQKRSERGMAKHHTDLVLCRKQPGIAIGRLCEKHDVLCVICDSYVRPCTLVRVCDECNYGSFQGRCVICGGAGIADAYYCKECTILEKDVRPPCSPPTASSKQLTPCPLSCPAEGWLPQDREPGQLPDRPILRQKEVRLQEAVTRAKCSFP